ncbi:hypothetical protein BN437_2959 [Erwinia amylovora NBRC 12687 = CFBP 1232]|uniref:Uncharacterized protein n=1 Tax=Erwinia amylovora NBRC 12687 = CFBP 1232 TaxID=1219359 RepID=A0A831ES23_ERWAM|nr:hypothetical protein BN432_2948 [Erwinia amylovora Ea356]CCO94869.1 hypothetical protein BN437_2959 [Erwinia amylovora NBRC 12687 = CFBP 1232]
MPESNGQLQAEAAKYLRPLHCRTCLPEVVPQKQHSECKKASADGWPEVKTR